MTDASEQAVKYEPSDAAPWLIASLAAGIVLFLALSPLLLRFAFPSAVHRLAVGPYGSVLSSPVLQINPNDDLASFRRAEDEWLSDYGWIDRQQRTVHMPIERAKELMLQRRLPGWP